MIDRKYLAALVAGVCLCLSSTPIFAQSSIYGGWTQVYAVEAPSIPLNRKNPFQRPANGFKGHDGDKGRKSGTTSAIPADQKAIVARIAAALEKRRFYRVPAGVEVGDVIDPALSLAIRAYQAAREFPVDGIPTADLADDLEREGGVYAVEISPTAIDDPEVVRRIQSKLSSAGADISPDGKAGPSTAKAIREYQEKEGLLVDGQPSLDLMLRLTDEGDKGVEPDGPAGSPSEVIHPATTATSPP